MQRILCFLRNRMMLCFLRNRVILCFSKKQSDTIIISASVSPVIVHYCNNKKNCLYIAYGMHLQMIGLLKPTYGTAYIHGMDLRTDMNEIYANIGVCPQHEYDRNRLCQW